MITQRLQKIIDLVSEKIVADIGTDHAYIPIRLAEEKRITKCIASDKNRGPLDIAGENVSEYGFSDIIELRLGSGLEPIEVGECEQIIIAGMGGKLIGDIIENDLEKAKNAKLILQPMNAQAELRERLIKNGFKIIKEELAKEGFKVYNIISVESGYQKMPDDEIYLHLPKSLIKHPLYKMLTDKKKREFTKIITGNRNAKNPDFKEISKYEKLLEKIGLVGGITNEN